MKTLIKFINFLAHTIVGFLTIGFCIIGIAASSDKLDGIEKVSFVLCAFLLLGIWPICVAKRKKFWLSGIKLYFYVVFFPVISWINIFVTDPQKSDTASEMGQQKEIQEVENISQLKNYQTQWEVWEMEHDKPEQKKRWQKALSECSLVKMIDKNNGIASIAGNRGGEYITTLSVCNCSDFTKRHKPCKHMYFLANYLGVFEHLRK